MIAQDGWPRAWTLHVGLWFRVHALVEFHIKHSTKKIIMFFQFCAMIGDFLDPAIWLHKTDCREHGHCMYRKVFSSRLSWLVTLDCLWRGFLCIDVTFQQNGPKLNSRPMYCLQLYGILETKTIRLTTFSWNCLWAILFSLKYFSLIQFWDSTSVSTLPLISALFDLSLLLMLSIYLYCI